MTPSPIARCSAAFVHLLGPVMLFLPGLAVWFYGQDRHPWLATQARRAAGFQAAIFAGYMLIAPTIPLAGPAVFSHRAPGAIFPALPSIFWHNPLVALLIYGGTIIFHALWWASVVFSVGSAVAVIFGRPCIYPVWPRSSRKEVQ